MPLKVLWATKLIPVMTHHPTQRRELMKPFSGALVHLVGIFIMCHEEGAHYDVQEVILALAGRPTDAHTFVRGVFPP